MPRAPSRRTAGLDDRLSAALGPVFGGAGLEEPSSSVHRPHELPTDGENGQASIVKQAVKELISGSVHTAASSWMGERSSTLVTFTKVVIIAYPKQPCAQRRAASLCTAGGAGG